MRHTHLVVSSSTIPNESTIIDFISSQFMYTTTELTTENVLANLGKIFNLEIHSQEGRDYVLHDKDGNELHLSEIDDVVR